MIQEHTAQASTALPLDYAERVYAGVLGKIIGVYLGRPVENWSYERIADRFGEIRYYVHEQLGRRLIITDDDISGTFVFLRAMQDHGSGLAITPEQIGATWLNYLIERKTILWWGGLGNSTEHTAFLRLKSGITAPESGSTALNGQVVAEQIGAQIFIDGWGLISPGDPEQAADLARRAASVSHDGEAIYGAQVIASLVALAFRERSIDKLLDDATSRIPAESVIARMIRDLRNWHAQEADWRVNRQKLEEAYGYHVFGGNCHMVPNHGAIILSLLHGAGDFSESLHIVNTIGWDTDCNSGNLGSILGVLNGIEGIEAGLDWRRPVADRLFLPCGNPGLAITDAARVAVEVTNLGRAIKGLPLETPKDGARFHFSLPGSVQGFRVDPSFESAGATSISNTNGHLAIQYRGLAKGRSARVFTDTFIPLETKDLVTGYVLVASPTLHPGQTVRARCLAQTANAGQVDVKLYVRYYDGSDSLTTLRGEPAPLSPGAEKVLEWTVPSTDGRPIAEIGLEIAAQSRADGVVELDWLRWDGVPDVLLTPLSGTMWARAWGAAIDRFDFGRDGFKHLAQDRGIGHLIMGSDHWRDYRVESTAWVQMAKAFGIAARVQGLSRYYALLCRDGWVELVKRNHGTSVLATAPMAIETYQPTTLRLEVQGISLRGWVGDVLMVEATDADLEWGGVAFVVEEGCMGAEGMKIGPLA